jgi:hypothetical protein
MDSGDLKREQLEQLKGHVGRTQRYFDALQARMLQQFFPYDDDIRQTVNGICDGLHSLWVKLHYLSCHGQCGTRKKATSGELRTSYRLQVVATPNAPFSPQFMQDVEAETPLESITKLARHGALSNKLNPFWVRFILSTDAQDRPERVITLELTSDFVRPHVK